MLGQMARCAHTSWLKHGRTSASGRASLVDQDGPGELLDRRQSRCDRAIGHCSLAIYFLSIFCPCQGMGSIKVPLSAPAVSGMFASKCLSYCRRSEEHTSELQSRPHLVCRLLLEKK